MAESQLPRSKRQMALELTRRLLTDIDNEKIVASTAVQRLARIAHLIGDKAVEVRCRSELDGYPSFGSTVAEAKKSVRTLIKNGQLKNDVDIESTAKNLLAMLPDYRRASLSYDFGHGFKSVELTDPVAKYEELLERIRKDTKTRYKLSDGGVTVNWSAAELSRLVFGVRRWAYEEAYRIEELLEFGQIPARAIETTFEFVDAQLLAIVPKAAERLITAYRNLAERNQENWENVVDTCRRVIKDFADAVYPARSESVDGMVVSDDKYLNRVRAFVKENVESRRQAQQTDSVLQLLGELLAKTDNLASRSVHSGAVSRYEAERVLGCVPIVL